MSPLKITHRFIEEDLSDTSYILHVVEAERGAAACVLYGFSGEGLVVTVDETEINASHIVEFETLKQVT